MPTKIFISYRRDDDPAAAARVCDGLARRFGKSNLFMDVDNLLAGQRFDEERNLAPPSCVPGRSGVGSADLAESRGLCPSTPEKQSRHVKIPGSRADGAASGNSSAGAAEMLG